MTWLRWMWTLSPSNSRMFKSPRQTRIWLKWATDASVAPCGKICRALVCSRMLTYAHVMLTYADVCWRMLTDADICWRMLTDADGCWRMLMCADVCWRMLTDADVCWRESDWNEQRMHLLHNVARLTTATIYASSYYHICVLILPYVSSYYYMCVLIRLNLKCATDAPVAHFVMTCCSTSYISFYLLLTCFTCCWHAWLAADMLY